jgi:hypothetical protein
MAGAFIIVRKSPATVADFHDLLFKFHLPHGRSRLASSGVDAFAENRMQRVLRKDMLDVR